MPPSKGISFFVYTKQNTRFTLSLLYQKYELQLAEMLNISFVEVLSHIQKLLTLQVGLLMRHVKNPNF